MKAVLVINMPDKCAECELSKICVDYSSKRAIEIVKGIGVERRLDDCPLRLLPQFMDEAVPYQVSETEVDCYQDPYATGFNDAIRLIVGEIE